MSQPIYFRHSSTYNLALNNTTPTQSAVPVVTGHIYVRLVASQDSWVRIDGTNQAAVGVGSFMPAGFVETRMIAAGDVISAITDTAAAANLNVVLLGR